MPKRATASAAMRAAWCSADSARRSPSRSSARGEGPVRQARELAIQIAGTGSVEDRAAAEALDELGRSGPVRHQHLHARRHRFGDDQPPCFPPRRRQHDDFAGTHQRGHRKSRRPRTMLEPGMAGQLGFQRTLADEQAGEAQPVGGIKQLDEALFGLQPAKIADVEPRSLRFGREGRHGERVVHDRVSLTWQERSGGPHRAGRQVQEQTALGCRPHAQLARRLPEQAPCLGHPPAAIAIRGKAAHPHRPTIARSGFTKVVVGTVRARPEIIVHVNHRGEAIEDAERRRGQPARPLVQD